MKQLHHSSSRRTQGGGVAIMVGLTLAVLIGFAGLVIDLGHLYVTKTELVSAMDACALAAAQELDGSSDALDRAKIAGSTVGSLNKVNFQGSFVNVSLGDISFSETLDPFTGTATAASARYVQCTTSTAIPLWFMPAFYAGSGIAGNDSSTVGALAAASRVISGQACALPVGLRPKVGESKPNYGYVVGEWVATLYDEDAKPPATPNGEWGWYNLDGTNSATELKKELKGAGYCTAKIDDKVGTPGEKFSVAELWNARFGLYADQKIDELMQEIPPDYTGYSYTIENWPDGKNAFIDFKDKRLSNASYGDSIDTYSEGNNLTKLNMKGKYKDKNMATHGSGGDLSKYGTNKRLVIIPVVNDLEKIEDWACMLMLHPIDAPKGNVYLEFRGNASDPTSPCASFGIPGGTSGPLVSALVR
jgi:Flp pilus assembly protein TadG